MIDKELINELEMLHAFLHGAHLATADENCSSLLHLACHKIDEILKGIKLLT